MAKTIYSITSELLEELCDQYDGENYTYPQSELEGKAVFEFVMEKVKVLYAKAIENKNNVSQPRNMAKE